MEVTITPYLMLDGRAQEAIQFYQEIFGAEIMGQEFLKDWPGEMGIEVTPENEGRVMHAHLKIGSSEIMLADYLPGQIPQPGSSINLMIVVKDAETAKKLFSLLLNGGKEIMPLQETGFSPATGQVADKFGIEWQIVTDQPDAEN
ncbi:VOC family protein [Cohnella hongkongensis]|uniref:VOC family protein n=1 Tax=Cohnella hongkongensis TaxID=178337 RepID=A0ABV9FAU0_9BACL